MPETGSSPQLAKRRWDPSRVVPFPIVASRPQARAYQFPIQTGRDGGSCDAIRANRGGKSSWNSIGEIPRVDVSTGKGWSSPARILRGSRGVDLDRRVPGRSRGLPLAGLDFHPARRHSEAGRGSGENVKGEECHCHPARPLLDARAIVWPRPGQTEKPELGR